MLEVGHIFLYALAQQRQSALGHILHLSHRFHFSLQDLHFLAQPIHLVLQVLGFLQIDGIVVEPSARFIGEIGPVGGRDS